MRLRRFLPLASAAVASVACSGPAPVPDTFTRTGELIALSGGAGGAAGACVTCHGLKGEGDGHLAPRLAGLDRGYLLRQLEQYRDGLRAHPQMMAIARGLSTDERGLVADHYAALETPRGRADCATPNAMIAGLYQRGDARRGIASCAACHGADGGGNAGNPPLAGQSAAYLADQIDRWRDGRRHGDPMGTMTRISQRLRPDEVAAVAAYAGRLGGGPGRREFRATCLPARRADPKNDA